MKGYLRIAILKELARAELTGYDIMRRLEVAIGNRPSPGSMYPMLKDLQAKGFLNSRREGRRKLYSITKSGRSRIKALCDNKLDLLNSHVQFFKIYGSIYGDKTVLPMLDKLTQEGLSCECRHKGVDPADLIELHTRIIDTLINIEQLSEQKSFSKIIKETNAKLSKLKRQKISVNKKKN